MSDKRDFIRLTKTIGTSINAGISKQFSFDANLATNVKMGPILSDAHNGMHGRVEQIAVYFNNTTVGAGVSPTIFFYCDSNHDCATLTTDPYLDHEDFTKATYAYNNSSKKPQRNASVVAIQYFNLTNDKKVHIAIKNNSATVVIAKDILRVDLTFRPDYGE